MPRSKRGAQVVQLFDSWVGCLDPEDYRHYVLPHMQQILSGVAAHVPVINFGTGNPELLPLLRGDRRTVVGIDWAYSPRRSLAARGASATCSRESRPGRVVGAT